MCAMKCCFLLSVSQEAVLAITWSCASASYLSPESLLQSKATASCGLCCLKVQLEKGSQPVSSRSVAELSKSFAFYWDTAEIKINSWPVLFSITVDVQRCKDHPASPWWAFQILATVNMQRTGWLYNMTLTQLCAFLSFPFLFCLLFSDTVSCGPGSVARMCLNSPIFLPPPTECLGYGCESVSHGFPHALLMPLSKHVIFVR